MAFLLDGQPLAVDTPFKTPDGTQYPANWLRLSTAEEKTAIGITEVPDPTPYDQRFYWGPGLPKDHGQLVEQWTAATRTTAGTLLQPSDWMVIREMDNGTAMDPAIKTWREDIRLATGAKVTAIADTADTDALAAYITGADYPAWPVDPYAPVPATEDEVAE
jgi:hypothetical protein